MAARANRKLRKAPICYVIGEGATEAKYFAALKQALAGTYDPKRPRPAIEPKDAGGNGAVGVAETAKAWVDRVGPPHKDLQYFAVLDTEAAEPKYQGQLTEALRICQNGHIHVIVSNPCFEVWFHCHCQTFKPRAFNNQAACVSSLNTAWRKCDFCKEGYEKPQPRAFEESKDQLENAISKAEDLREAHHGDQVHTKDANAATDVYRLIKFLQNPKADPFRGEFHLYMPPKKT